METPSPTTSQASPSPTGRRGVTEADVRYEMKMIFQALAHHRVMSELYLLPAALKRLYPPRRVQSVYLDTHDGRALEESLAGVSDREKIRFRWYGDQTRKVTGHLECKFRQSQLGWKKHFKLEQPLAIEGVGRTAWVKELTRRLTHEWRERLAGLEAAQWISYSREYLTTADKSVRVTVDHDLRVSDQRYRATLSSRHGTPLPNVTIVECKTSTRQFEALRELLSNFPLVVDKCSKFVLASDPGSGPTVSIYPS